MNKKAICFVLAGGGGSRLAPLSMGTEGKLPKQFLSIVTEKTMLQETIDRIPEGVEKVVVCLDKYRKEVERQIGDKAKVLAEPFGCNTAAAIGLSAVYAEKEYPEENPVLFFCPADHIMDKALFQSYFWQAVNSTSDGKVVAIGMTPDRPETGLGYIRTKEPIEINGGQIYTIHEFVEKPNLEKAIEFVQSGEYLWNGGMFCFDVKTVMAMLEKNAPKIAGAVKKIKEGLGTNAELELIGTEYQKLKDEKENISIDYAVMEKEAKNILLVKASTDLAWDDIGLWAAVEKYFPKDGNGNTYKGTMVFNGCKNTTALNYDQEEMEIEGLEDTMIVNSPNGVLLCPRSETIRASEIVSLIESGEKEILIDSSGISIENKTEKPVCFINLNGFSAKLSDQKLLIKKI